MITAGFSAQLWVLLLLAVPIACVSWTVTHEELFREIREYFERRADKGRTIFERKFFYLFTCEYCFSHYVTLLALWMSGFTLLLPGWRGYVLAGFALVWVANMYMSVFGRLRLGIKREGKEIAVVEKALEEDPPKLETPRIRRG